MQIITKTDGSFEGCHFIDYGTLRASQDHPHYDKIISYFT
jgi:hypothetical protein